MASRSRTRWRGLRLHGVASMTCRHTQAAVGLAVGGMHAAADHFASQLPRFRLNQRYLLAWPVRLARPFFAHRPDDWAYVRGLARQLTSRLEALADAGLSQGVCHRDIVGK